MHVVIGIILNTKNEVLIAERQAHQSQPGVWEFPGGKVEAGEAPLAALQRELLEELNIHVLAAEPWLNFPYTYKDYTVQLNTFLVTHYQGTASGHEGQRIRWAKLSELQELPFPAGNKIIIKRLLPPNPAPQQAIHDEVE